LKLDTLPGHAGIGHTRWATNGKVYEINAHPHLCSDDSIAVVHNGIIENYCELRKELEKEGPVEKFPPEPRTLIARYFAANGMNLRFESGLQPGSRSNVKFKLH
jgi:glutamine phosphoribosylpyrophosphate amidotransferase